MTLASTAMDRHSKLRALCDIEKRSPGSSNDLAQFAPLMIEATFRHFGDTTPDSVRFQFSEEEIKKLQESK